MLIIIPRFPVVDIHQYSRILPSSCSCWRYCSFCAASQESTLMICYFCPIIDHMTHLCLLYNVLLSASQDNHPTGSLCDTFFSISFPKTIRSWSWAILVLLVWTKELSRQSLSKAFTDSWPPRLWSLEAITWWKRMCIVSVGIEYRICKCECKWKLVNQLDVCYTLKIYITRTICHIYLHQFYIKLCLD